MRAHRQLKESKGILVINRGHHVLNAAEKTNYLERESGTALNHRSFMASASIHGTCVPSSLFSSSSSSKISSGSSISLSRSTVSLSRPALFTRRRVSSVRRGSLNLVRASGDRVDLDENPEGILSGEWPENFSLLSYEDLRAYLEPKIFKEKMKPSALLGDVMSTAIHSATVDQTLEEIEHHFEYVSGLPVVDGDFKCIGILSKRDKARATNGMKSTVGEVMSSPPITMLHDRRVLDAAALMLKEKIHRIPVVEENGQVVGMVTRTDIFQALEGLPC
ncbi:uncharacterized protein LOC18426033 [Amborella trichopoda]|nr:uncharacterized protein LOC18426033 [Amborella trichopoda]|eukprot:XP_020517921.1 uncharacterized protein LOC18426033 [Amborella trichopoda]